MTATEECVSMSTASMPVSPRASLAKKALTLIDTSTRAIERMRAVLESPSSLLALSHLVKAQQTYHAKAAAFLSAIEGQLDDAAVAAEACVAAGRAR